MINAHVKAAAAVLWAGAAAPCRGLHAARELSVLRVFCIQSDGFCITNDGFCNENDESAFKMMAF